MLNRCVEYLFQKERGLKLEVEYARNLGEFTNQFFEVEYKLKDEPFTLFVFLDKDTWLEFIKKETKNATM